MVSISATALLATCDYRNAIFNFIQILNAILCNNFHDRTSLLSYEDLKNIYVYIKLRIKWICPAWLPYWTNPRNKRDVPNLFLHHKNFKWNISNNAISSANRPKYTYWIL